MNRQPVTLHAHDSINLSTGQVTRSSQSQTAKLVPWYPLVGHRDGLRANDLVTLASAFWIYALETGTLYQNDQEASIY